MKWSTAHFVNWVRARTKAIAFGIGFLAQFVQFLGVKYLVLGSIALTPFFSSALCVVWHISVTRPRHLLPPDIFTEACAESKRMIVNDSRE